MLQPFPTYGVMPNVSSTNRSPSSSEVDDEAVDDIQGDVNSLHHKLSPRMRKVV